MKTNLKQLQNALIYTKESIARVLGVTVKRIRRTMLWWAGFWIWVEGKRPRLYKKSLFAADFANFRQTSAKKLVVLWQGATNYRVTNLETATGNYVTSNVIGGNVKYDCSCEDFKAMSAAFKAPACKHIYAVLGYQGFATLKEAIVKHQAEYDAKMAIGL